MERKFRRARGQKGKDKPMGEAEHRPISLNQEREGKNKKNHEEGNFYYEFQLFVLILWSILSLRNVYIF
jgi:hypothetical protein